MARSTLFPKLSSRARARVSRQAFRVLRAPASTAKHDQRTFSLVPSLTPLSAMTRAEFAARSGTAKEVAAVASFETAGAIVRAKGHIALVDRQRLATFISRP
jgi:hypothetical protein